MNEVKMFTDSLKTEDELAAENAHYSNFLAVNTARQLREFPDAATCEAAADLLLRMSELLKLQDEAFSRINQIIKGRVNVG